MAGVGIAVLGPLTIDDSGTLGRRDRVILEALVARAGRPVSTDQLADAVWGDRPPASAAKNIQGCVVRLRKLLGQDAIVTSADGYQLALPAGEVDSQRFERGVARSRELLVLGEHDRAAFQLTEALALWRGEPFGALEGWVGAESEVRRLQELRLDAEELRIEAHIGAGRYRDVLAEAQALVSAAPVRERRWALLAHAQYLTGRQGDALRTIHQLKSVLSEHLGIDPGPDVVALEGAILRQDDSLLGSAAPAEARATCPYQGLLAFELDDVERFFGREDDVESCHRVLRRSPLLALVGPSGSGKSSLLRAGLAAALRDAGQASVVIMPGRRPLQALTVLGGAPASTALLVDQFEEVFTLCEDTAERAGFIGRLVAELHTRTVVIALRSDRLADLAAHPDLSVHVEEGLHLVAGLGEEGLRQAVEAPARQAGLHLEPGLVDLLVREVEGDPGALPLFSHALLETWKRREGNTLTVDGYRASGGIHGAVAQSAERLYAETDREHRPMLRDLVLRLVSPGPDGEPVRTRVPRRLIAADADHDQMVDALVAARLVTSDDGALEITHEALARAWPRLRSWLDDDVEGQRLLHHLSAAADAWDSMGRPDSELYRGVRLVRALDWKDRTTSALTETERAFLDRARTVAEIEEQTAAERARSQARLIRRLRIVLGGAVALLVLALAAGGVAAVQSDRANENAARAARAAVAADAGRVGVRAQVVRDFSLPLLLAVAGARLDDSSETRANLFTTLARQPKLIRSAEPGGGYLNYPLVSRDGRWIASGDDSNRLHLYDTATNRLVNSWEAEPPTELGPGWIMSAFSPDSRRLAVVPYSVRSSEPVVLLDRDSMQESAVQLAPAGARPFIAIDVRFSADGSHLAAAMFSARKPGPLAQGTPAWVMVWDLRSPSEPPARIPTGILGQLVALSPDGRILYTNRPVTAWDVESGEVLWQREELESSALDITFEGDILAIEDHATLTDVLLLDSTDGTTVRTLGGHRDWPNDARFSPDGSLLGTVTRSGELAVWEVATGRHLHRWFTYDAWGVGFSPDNRLVHTGGGADTMLRTWDISYQDTFVRRTARVDGPALFARADVSPDGGRVAYSWIEDEQGWITFTDPATGAATPPTRVPVVEDQRWFGTWPVGAWHPDSGQYAVQGCADRCGKRGIVTVLDAATGTVIGRRDVVDRIQGDEWSDGNVWSLEYIDDGRSLLVSDAWRTGPRGRTLVLDSETLEPRGEAFDVPSQCCATAIGSGTAALVFETGLDGESERWRIVDSDGGEVIHEGVLEDFAWSSASSPDGSVVAVAGYNGEVVTIDVATGDVLRRSLRLGTEALWVRYSDDGARLVTGDTEGGVTLWDAATLERLGTVYPPHRGAPVSDVPASPCNGGGQDTCAGSGAEFIGDSHDVVIASYDGSIYRWDTDVDRALDFACQMAGRDLTEAEWEQYLPAQPYESVCPQD
ncbi:BTAD domain-containing putative transcriptional regulator [Nocardioides eburneiflavus]|uniref:nSTAND1 domain-containing NTPase n=1 Tax=Nocardioides eburneiflavus TaxID=2518372 RepID=UPI00143D0107|nr:BTAD domain-containing putative transcriptional regulator [Nocardioides eburneiflavus]